MAYDEETTLRLGRAVYAAIVNTLARDGKVELQSAALFDVLMDVGSVLIAGDPQLSTAKGLKVFADAYAKHLRKQVQEAQNDPDRASLFHDEFVVSKH